MVKPAPVSRAVRAASLALLVTLASLLSSGVVTAYNNWDNVCGKWPNANPIGIQWKWDGDINQSGNWAYAFATVAEPNWDNSFTKIELGYNSSAAGEYGVYNTAHQWYGLASVWCGINLCPCYIIDFLAEGNLHHNNDSSYNAYMGNVAGHEIGHTLGYGHSCCAAVMQQGYAGSWPTLDDTQGMGAMYYP